MSSLIRNVHSKMAPVVSGFKIPVPLFCINKGYCILHERYILKFNPALLNFQMQSYYVTFFKGSSKEDKIIIKPHITAAVYNLRHDFQDIALSRETDIRVEIQISSAYLIFEKKVAEISNVY